MDRVAELDALIGGALAWCARILRADDGILEIEDTQRLRHLVGCLADLIRLRREVGGGDDGAAVVQVEELRRLVEQLRTQ